MSAKAVGKITVFAILGAGLIATSCSSGPQPPKPGTPAFYWLAAKETYAAGDYQKTNEHLEQICRTQNDYTARAHAWNLILTAGMARSYMELADYFEYGSRARALSPTQFRRLMSDYRTYASRLALQFAQTFQDFEKNNKDANVTLDFTFPTGNALPSPQITKIGNGELPSPAILDDLRKQHLKTGVLLQTCRALGIPDDSAKAQQIFKSGSVQVPRETFLLAMAAALHDQAQLFVRSKLDQPDRLKMFDGHALDVVKSLPETKEATALSTKIQKSLKLVSGK
ncbi:MAG: hypothetical protein ACM336_04410 [Acidobacteriota bacterium]